MFSPLPLLSLSSPLLLYSSARSCSAGSVLFTLSRGDHFPSRQEEASDACFTPAQGLTHTHTHTKHLKPFYMFLGLPLIWESPNVPSPTMSLSESVWLSLSLCVCVVVCVGVV